jgi:hypothetical protein
MRSRQVIAIAVLKTHETRQLDQVEGVQEHPAIVAPITMAVGGCDAPLSAASPRRQLAESAT